jgi:hypothetical protein
MNQFIPQRVKEIESLRRPFAPSQSWHSSYDAREIRLLQCV